MLGAGSLIMHVRSKQTNYRYSRCEYYNYAVQAASATSISIIVRESRLTPGTSCTGVYILSHNTLPSSSFRSCRHWVCFAGESSPRIWSLLLLHSCHSLLHIWNIKTPISWYKTAKCVQLFKCVQNATQTHMQKAGPNMYI